MLKPSESLIGSLALATLVYTTYQIALPPIADIRVAPQENTDIAGAERLATLASAAVVSFASVVVKDTTMFIVGGTMVLFMSWAYRHANQVSPLTGRVSALWSRSASESGGMDAAA